MTAVLQLDVTCSVEWDARADTESRQPQSRGVNKYFKRLTYGTGAGQVNRFWEDERTVTAGSNDDIDLTAITMTIPVGSVTVGFGAVKFIQIENLTTTTGYYLLVGKVSSVTNGWEGPFHTVAGGVQKVEPDGAYSNAQRSAAGWTVDSTHKVLRINNPSAGSITYRITLAGEA